MFIHSDIAHILHGRKNTSQMLLPTELHAEQRSSRQAYNDMLTKPANCNAKKAVTSN